MCVRFCVCVCLQSPSLSLLANTKSLLEGGAEREEEETGAHSVPQGRAKWGGGPRDRQRGPNTTTITCLKQKHKYLIFLLDENV